MWDGSGVVAMTALFGVEMWFWGDCGLRVKGVEVVAMGWMAIEW